MNRLKYAVAMLVAGGAAGAASQATAAVYTDTFDYAGPTDGTSFNYDVTLTHVDGVTMQYYGGVETVPVAAVKHHLSSDGTVRFDPLSYSTPGFGTNPSSYVKNDIVTYAGPAPTSGYASPLSLGSDTFYHLTFNADGKNYLGYADFDSAQTLHSVTYGAVPEPAAWTLLIAGAGAAGAALRRARRKGQLPAAA